jgi:hypothetical protein
VNDRLLVTPWAARTGPKGDVRLGDVCPEPVAIGTKLRDLGPIAASVPAAAVGGGQDGRQAFVVDRREVPP